MAQACVAAIRKLPMSQLGAEMDQVVVLLTRAATHHLEQWHRGRHVQLRVRHRVSMLLATPSAARQRMHSSVSAK